MRHLATISEGRFERIPFHAECSCGVAGDFASEQEAHDWMQYTHFAKLTGIAYGEFFSAPTPKPPAPASPPEPGGEDSKKNETEQAETPVQNEAVGGA